MTDNQKHSELLAENERLTEQVEQLESENGSFQGLVATLETELSRLRDERKELVNLLRETVMRAHFAMPENDQDADWFDENRGNADFVEQIFTVLKLGKFNDSKS